MTAVWFTVGFIAGMFTGVVMMAVLVASSANWES